MIMRNTLLRLKAVQSRTGLSRETRFRPFLHLALGAVACVLGSTPPISAQGAGSPAIQLRGVENLGIGPKAAMATAGADLLALYAEYKAHLQQTSGQGAAAPAFRSSNPIAPIAGGSVVIDAAASGDPEALAADLRALGADKVTVFGRMVSARVPIQAIPGLNSLSSLQLARPSYMATQTGDVTSQGDAAMRSDIARTAFGIDGAGVQIGTLSDSYNCLGGAAARVASGDLPTAVAVLDELDFCSFGTDEGQAMMEIIHDVAPGSPLSFHTAFEGQASFAQGIIDLAGAGAKVINDDVLYFSEPMFQDGIVAQAIDQVKARGVSYFSAAGNFARGSYESPFRPSNVFIDLGTGPQEAHDFDPGPGVDICQKITIPVGRTMRMVLQWDEPYRSLSGPPGSANDIDIVLTNAACDTMITGSFEPNLGGDPFEFLGSVNETGTVTHGIVIMRFVGPNPGFMKMVSVGSSSVTIDEYGTGSSTSWGHSGALGGLGVGAANFRDTPVFGVNPPLIEGFSSAGGSPILFDTAGNRLAVPQVRQQPDITAPDGGDTVSFGAFFGTSAAAPHAAGVAALMKDLVPALTPDATYAALKSTAIDMDDPSTGGFDTGFDFGTGFGLIQADVALNEVAPEPAPIPPVAPPVVPPAPPVTPPAPPVQPVPPIAPPAPPVAPLPPLPPVGPVTPTVPVEPRQPVLCRGIRATIVGTDGRDLIIGTPGPDVIHGLDGNDVIRGNGGKDVICGGSGKDRLFGGPGRDRLFGDSGKDLLNAGTGRDRCNGGSGADTSVNCERKTRIP